MPARPPTPLLALLALLLWAGTASAEGVPYPWQVLGRDRMKNGPATPASAGKRRIGLSGVPGQKA